MAASDYDPTKLSGPEQELTAFEIIDLREQAHRQEMERQTQKAEYEVQVQKQRTKQSRKDVYITFIVGFFIVAVILGLSFAIYKGTRPGPYSDAPSKDERRETACMNTGGTWLPAALVVGDEGVCIMPGKAPSIPSDQE